MTTPYSHCFYIDDIALLKLQTTHSCLLMTSILLASHRMIIIPETKKPVIILYRMVCHAQREFTAREAATSINSVERGK